MISAHRILQLPTFDGKKIEVEVNWSDNQAVKDCKIVRFREGETCFEVSRDALVTILMIIGREADQKKLMPLKTTGVKVVQRMLGFEFDASRDYRKGEKISVRAPWIDQITTEDEILSGALSKRKSKHLINGKLR